MGKTTRILIVSAATGNGHLRAGEALKAVIQQRKPGWRVEHLDVLTLAPRWVRLAYGGGFELLAARAPRVWGGIYRWADGPEGDHARWAALAERTVFRAFRRLLLRGGWDLCLCTHFLPAQLAAGRAGMPPFALVVTDYTLHRFWAQPRVHRYFVASDALAADILARLPEAVVRVTGIPVHPSFAQPASRIDACHGIGVDPMRPVITIMGGGLGLGVEENLDAVLDGAPVDAQVIVICGRNAAARERLEQRDLPARVQVVGFVTGIERIVAASDVIVTKPGGLTTSEALALGRPLVLTRPLPGHERANVIVLQQTGAALSADTPAELRDAMTTLWNEPGRLAAMSAAAHEAGHAHAAEQILHSIDFDLRQAAAA